jgi:hypothetical protein
VRTTLLFPIISCLYKSFIPSGFRCLRHRPSKVSASRRRLDQEVLSLQRSQTRVPMSKDLGYHALAIAVPVFVHKSQGLLSRLCLMRVSDASFHDPVYDVEFLVTFDRVAVPMDRCIFSSGLGTQRSGTGRGRPCTSSLSDRRSCWFGDV